MKLTKTLSGNDQAQARRDGDVFVDRVQVARRSRPRQRKGDEEPAHGEDDGEGPMPFDFKRMVYGGFKILVDA
jgi:uncharacterized protein YbaA (DUF1428 family)